MRRSAIRIVIRGFCGLILASAGLAASSQAFAGYDSPDCPGFGETAPGSGICYVPPY